MNLEKEKKSNLLLQMSVEIFLGVVTILVVGCCLGILIYKEIQQVRSQDVGINYGVYIILIILILFFWTQYLFSKDTNMMRY